MAFCGTRLDDPTEGLIQESLFRRKVKYEVRRVRFGAYEARREIKIVSLAVLLDPQPARAGVPGFFGQRW
jgi:hypothetical protein